MKKVTLLGAALLAALLGCSTGTDEPAGKTSKGFVLVAGGTFTMGSPNTEENRGENEGPQHQVTVSSFYMGKYEVTQGEWEEVMDTTLSQQRDTAQTAEGETGLELYGEGDSYPMYYVNWLEAAQYCNARSADEGLTPAYTIEGGSVTCDWDANGYRLPTEAEWEYAAKGGNKSSGYVYAGSDTVGNVGWYDENSDSTAHQVGTKAANELGIYDISGNVWEWCWDWYDDYEDSAQTNPRGSSSPSNRVPRGGSWNDSAQFLRSSRRGSAIPSGRYSVFGFRLARSL